MQSLGREWAELNDSFSALYCTQLCDVLIARITAFVRERLSTILMATQVRRFSNKYSANVSHVELCSLKNRESEGKDERRKGK